MNFIRIRNFKGAICQQHRFYTAQPVSWTNAGLKRLRKAQLESLAREHKLNSEGTKAQLIARLLNHPKEPEMQQQIEEFEATEASHAHPVNDNVEREMMQEVQQEVAGRTGITSRHSHENELEAANWIEAFELKVNQRRTRDRRAGSFFPGNKRDITGQAALDSSAVAPPTEETQKKGREPTAFATNDATITPEDMDVEWVKAFEQKAMNRAFRKRDTFIATDTRIDSVPQPQAEVVSKREPASTDIQDALFTVVPPSSPETDKVKAAAGSESSSSPKTDTERGNSRAPDANHEQISSSPEPISSTRNRLINIVVASSLAVWVTSGEEGFRKLLDIFAGSP